ncbi:hypothetical protein [Marinobacterium stanieri]|nr:hypothetical protein [Marinobacterium stanieri]
MLRLLQGGQVLEELGLLDVVIGIVSNDEINGDKELIAALLRGALGKTSKTASASQLETESPGTAQPNGQKAAEQCNAEAHASEPALLPPETAADQARDLVESEEGAMETALDGLDQCASEGAYKHHQEEPQEQKQSNSELKPEEPPAFSETHEVTDQNEPVSSSGGDTSASGSGSQRRRRNRSSSVMGMMG